MQRLGSENPDAEKADRRRLGKMRSLKKAKAIAQADYDKGHCSQCFVA